MAKTEIALSIQELMSAVASGLSDVARKPNFYNYQPHKKQIEFHRSTAHGRLYLGGNRSGKTVGGILENISFMTGRHNYRDKMPQTPTYGRIVTVDFKNGWEKIIQPVLRQWIPPSDLINGSWEDSWHGSLFTLTLANGSKAEVMSHEQPLEKFAGTSRHWTHFDEECPESIFKECLARLVDTNGNWWMTMTPIEGMTWVYDTIFQPFIDGDNPGVDVITVDMADNPYLPEESRVNYLASLSDEDKNIRGKGEFVALGGLIFNQFRYDLHVVEHRLPPYEWEWWRSIDHGVRNPTAVMWHAINPSGSVYTFAEHYRSDWTVKMHTDRIHQMDEEFGKIPERTVGDPAMRQRQAVTGHSLQIEYSKNSIPVAMANNAVEAGLDKMNEYLRQGKWIISNNCVNLLKEIRKYKRKNYSSPKLKDSNNPREEPQKKDDHAIDSSRYLFSFMPELKPMPDHDKAQVNASVAEIMQAQGSGLDLRRARVYPWQRDPNLGRPQAVERGWGEI